MTSGSGAGPCVGGRYAARRYPPRTHSGIRERQRRESRGGHGGEHDDYLHQAERDADAAQCRVPHRCARTDRPTTSHHRASPCRDTDTKSRPCTTLIVAAIAERRQKRSRPRILPSTNVALTISLIYLRLSDLTTVDGGAYRNQGRYPHCFAVATVSYRQRHRSAALSIRYSGGTTFLPAP